MLNTDQKQLQALHFVLVRERKRQAREASFVIDTTPDVGILMAEQPIGLELLFPCAFRARRL